MQVVQKLQLVAACLCFCGGPGPAVAVRLSDADMAEPAPKKEAGPFDAQKVQQELTKWFDEHTLQSSAVPKADGNIDDGKWDYMNSECFQQRYWDVANEVLKRECKVVIEVGGYLTPLDAFLFNTTSDKKKLPKRYINIDPSMKNVKVEEKNGLRSYHLPMTIADFVDGQGTEMRSKHSLKFSRENSCAVIFGIWDPHVSDDKDANAFEALLAGVHFAAIETSEYAKNWLHRTTQIGTNALLHQVADKDVDCRKVPGLEGKHDPTTLLRHVRFLGVDKGGKKKEEKKGL